MLLLHPHPLFGGTMGSRLVYDLAAGLAAAGMRVVRFDFRGVGRSAGEHGNGIGEVGDAQAAFDALAAEARAGRSDAQPAVVGYSFGGGVATRLATLRPVTRLVAIGTPPRTLRSALVPIEDAPQVRAPAHLVVGDHDEHVSVAEARAFAAAFRPAATLTIVAGAGHFLEPSRNGDVLAAVLAALA
ncbi:MAG: alpha/beta fold hydrolase [Candidatus Thermoplasmatota archaeon]